MSTNFWKQKVCWLSPAIFTWLPQVNFPTNNLNLHWRWRWWDQIQALFLSKLTGSLSSYLVNDEPTKGNKSRNIYRWIWANFEYFRWKCLNSMTLTSMDFFGWPSWKSIFFSQLLCRYSIYKASSNWLGNVAKLLIYLFVNGILLPKLFWPTVRKKKCSSNWILIPGGFS